MKSKIDEIDNEKRDKAIDNAKHYIASIKKSLEEMENYLNNNNKEIQSIGGSQAAAIKLCLDEYPKHLENIVGEAIRNCKIGNVHDK